MTFKHLSHVVVVETDGKRYRIPQAWLISATYLRQKGGMDPIVAYHDAIQAWHSQSEMEAGR